MACNLERLAIPGLPDWSEKPGAEGLCMGLWRGLVAESRALQERIGVAEQPTYNGFL